MFFILRIIIGGILLISGFEKSLSAYQNFLYSIQAYQVLPSWAEILVAQIFPWIELIVGVFTVFGLWTQRALQLCLIIFGVFIVVVGQALLRGLPIENCGCFGSAIHFHPKTILVLDSFTLLMIIALLKFLPKTKYLSLDSFFDRR